VKLKKVRLVRSFNIICPFCDGAYPFPEHLDTIYRCKCGAVYKIAWRSDMEDAVDELIKFFLKDGEALETQSDSNLLCSAVIYEDIENLITMKREYESAKYFRQSLSFDQNYPQKVGLVWLGNYARRH
jgi:hypothetical protein